MTKNFTELANLIWQVADLLCGGYKQADYVKAILPFTLLHRLDSALETTKEDVLKEFDKREPEGVTDIAIEGQTAHNSIASGLLKHERTFAVMHGMLAELVRHQVKAAGSSDAR